MSFDYVSRLEELASEEEELRLRLHALEQVPKSHDLCVRLKDRLDEVVEENQNIKVMVILYQPVKSSSGPDHRKN
jgi:predicted transcriptional regulator